MAVHLWPVVVLEYNVPFLLCLLFLRESCDLVSTAAGCKRQPDFSLPTTSCVMNLWLSQTPERRDTIAGHVFTRLSVEPLRSSSGKWRHFSIIPNLSHCILDEPWYFWESHSVGNRKNELGNLACIKPMGKFHSSHRKTYLVMLFSPLYITVCEPLLHPTSTLCSRWCVSTEQWCALQREPR